MILYYLFKPFRKRNKTFFYCSSNSLLKEIKTTTIKDKSEKKEKITP